MLASQSGRCVVNGGNGRRKRRCLSVYRRCLRDVYGGGRSESLIRQFVKGPQEDFFIATKIGRKNYPGPYTPEVIRQHINDCRERMGVDVLDLVQLHCIPPQVMASGDVFDTLRACKQDGLIKNFGASAESMDEALMILDQPELTSLQIIFNIFRQKPITTLFDKAIAKNVGIIVRLPLASGLLAGIHCHYRSIATLASGSQRRSIRTASAFKGSTPSASRDL